MDDPWNLRINLSLPFLSTRVTNKYHHAWLGQAAGNPGSCTCSEDLYLATWAFSSAFSAPFFSHTCFINISNSPKLVKFDFTALAHYFPYSPWFEPSAMMRKIRWPSVLKWHSPKAVLIMISVLDYIWRRCPWLCQGTKKQISNQKVFCEASSNGLPASADCVRGGQHGNVSSGGSKADFHLIHCWTSSSQIPSFTPKCKQSLKFLSLFGFTLAEKTNKQTNTQADIQSYFLWKLSFLKVRLDLKGRKKYYSHTLLSETSKRYGTVYRWVMTIFHFDILPS